MLIATARITLRFRLEMHGACNASRTSPWRAAVRTIRIERHKIESVPDLRGAKSSTEVIALSSSAPAAIGKTSSL